MQIFAIIFFWKLMFSLKFIQCEVNSTLNTILLRSHPNVQLTDQDVYDLRDSLRKSNQFLDYIDDDDDDDEQEDYILNDEIENSNLFLTPRELTTLSSSVMFKSSSSSTYRQFQFIYLILLVLIQTIK